MNKKDLGETALGLEANVAGFLTYVLGFLSGLFFFLIEKDNKFVRFHAIQSMIIFGAIYLLHIVIRFVFCGPSMAILLKTFTALLNIASLIIWIILLIKSYEGEKFKLPKIGNFALKQANK